MPELPAYPVTDVIVVGLHGKVLLARGAWGCFYEKHLQK